MKVVIVGAAGFVGKYLTRELEAAGHSVVTADLPEVNLQNVGQVEALIESAKPDAVVNLAAISSVGASWKSPADTINVNVNGTLNLLEAIRKHAPQAKTLLIGSAEEYAIPEGRSPLKETDPLEASNPYGISKTANKPILGIECRFVDKMLQGHISRQRIKHCRPLSLSVNTLNTYRTAHPGTGMAVALGESLGR